MQYHEKDVPNDLFCAEKVILIGMRNITVCREIIARINIVFDNWRQCYYIINSIIFNSIIPQNLLPDPPEMGEVLSISGFFNPQVITVIIMFGILLF